MVDGMNAISNKLSSQPRQNAPCIGLIYTYMRNAYTVEQTCLPEQMNQ